MSAPTNFPITNHKFSLPGAAGAIEVATTPAKNVSQEVMVICHPHPLYGGTMENKVVTTVVRAAAAVEMATVRFNFRGVGQSEGEHDKGLGEAEDLLTVLAWLESVLPGAKLLLAGFSFGSYVAYRVATLTLYKDKLEKLILIAPPVQYPEFSALPEPQLPWVVLQGEADEVVEPEAVFTWLSQFKHVAELIRFPATSHFFHGKLVALKQALIRVLS